MRMGLVRCLFSFIEELNFHVMMVSFLFFGSTSELRTWVFLHAQEGSREHLAVEAQHIKIAFVFGGQTRDGSCSLTGGSSAVGAISRRGVAPGCAEELIWRGRGFSPRHEAGYYRRWPWRMMEFAMDGDVVDGERGMCVCL
jgi:hypothetical protein